MKQYSFLLLLTLFAPSLSGAQIDAPVTNYLGLYSADYHQLVRVKVDRPDLSFTYELCQITNANEVRSIESLERCFALASRSLSADEMVQVQNEVQAQLTDPELAHMRARALYDAGSNLALTGLLAYTTGWFLGTHPHSRLFSSLLALGSVTTGGRAIVAVGEYFKAREIEASSRDFRENLQVVERKLSSDPVHVLSVSGDLFARYLGALILALGHTTHPSPAP